SRNRTAGIPVGREAPRVATLGGKGLAQSREQLAAWRTEQGPHFVRNPQQRKGPFATVDAGSYERRKLAPRAAHHVGKAQELGAKNGLLDRKSTRLNSSHVKISYAV